MIIWDVIYDHKPLRQKYGWGIYKMPQGRHPAEQQTYNEAKSKLKSFLFTWGHQNPILWQQNVLMGRSCMNIWQTIKIIIT